MERFKNKKLENLVKISFLENNIKSIEPLINIEFPNLKFLMFLNVMIFERL